MDRNDCRFVGIIGERMKKGKTVNGEPYMYFDMNITSKYNANSTENNYEQNIPIMVFKPAVIKYLEKLKVHVGTPVIVFGFMSSFYDEVHGKQVLVNAVNANEVLCIQTRPYND
jgi:hypothetical protein